MASYSSATESNFKQGAVYLWHPRRYFQLAVDIISVDECTLRCILYWYKKGLVQNKSSLLPKIILYNTWTLQLVTINITN